METEKNNYDIGSVATYGQAISIASFLFLGSSTALGTSANNCFHEKGHVVVVGEPQKEYTNGGGYSTHQLEEGRGEMDNNRLLEMYIEKMNQDQSDLRNDMRSSEDRITRSIERMESKIDTMQKDTGAKIDNIQKDVGEMKDEVSSKLVDMQRDIVSYKSQLWGIALTSIVAVAGIVLAVIFGMPAWFEFVLK